MGYYATYWSTLLKGTRITALKERFEVRNAVNNLSSADHILYKSLFEKVEKSHRVTKAIKEEEKLLKKLKIASDKAYSLIFNLSTEEVTLLNTVDKTLKELDEFSNDLRSLSASNASTAQLRKVELDFANAVVEALKKAEAEDRKGFQNVMLIIDEAEQKDVKKFMSAIRLVFQKETQQTFLAKFAARQEIRRVKVDILELQKIPHIIEGVREEMKKKVKDSEEQRLIGQLYGTIQKVKKYLQDAFLELFNIKKRDMLLVLKVLLDLHNLREANVRWARNHLIPNSAALEKNSEIKKIQEDVSKHFHVIAQAFRIMITRIQRLEKEGTIVMSR